MFPARSDFAAPGAYAAWWYVNVGGGRRRVCATDGGNLVGDLSDFLRQMTWEFGSPDGSVTTSRRLRPGAGSMPPPVTGTVRVPPVPREIVAQLQQEVAGYVAGTEMAAARLARERVLLYLTRLQTLPLGAPSAVYQVTNGAMRGSDMLATVIRERLANLTGATRAPVEASEVVHQVLRTSGSYGGWSREFLSDLVVAMQADAVSGVGALRPDVAAAVGAEAHDAMAFLSGVWDRGALAAGGRFSDLLARLPRQILMQVHRDAASARIILEADAMSAGASYRGSAAMTRAVAQVEARALAGEVEAAGLAVARLGWLGRMRGFFRGMAGGFAVDMPRAGWAFSGAELASDIRWDGVFQSALAAYLRVTLGGSSVFSPDPDENLRLTLAWWHGLSPAWNAVYSQMVDDYNNHSVSITSVYVAAWMLSNVNSLHAEWRAFITDPRQARGFVGLDDVGVPTNAVMPPWNTPLRSACIVCPLNCSYDNTATTQPTSILPAGGAQRIGESSIRISLSDGPGGFGLSDVPASAVAKADGSTRSPLWIIASAAAVAFGGYLILRPKGWPHFKPR